MTKPYKEIWILKTPGGEFIYYDEPMRHDWSVCTKSKWFSAELIESEIKLQNELNRKLANHNADYSIEVNDLKEEIKQLKEAYDKLDDANIKYYEENKKLKKEYAWLIRHAWMCAAISKAKAAELLGVPLIDFDVKINEVLKDE